MSVGAFRLALLHAMALCLRFRLRHRREMPAEALDEKLRDCPFRELLKLYRLGSALTADGRGEVRRSDGRDTDGTHDDVGEVGGVPRRERGGAGHGAESCGAVACSSGEARGADGPLPDVPGRRLTTREYRHRIAELERKVEQAGDRQRGAAQCHQNLLYSLVREHQREREALAHAFAMRLEEKNALIKALKRRLASYEEEETHRIP